MKTYPLTVLLMGLGLAVGILYLVRRDHLYIRQGVFWIAIAAFSLLFGALLEAEHPGRMDDPIP